MQIETISSMNYVRKSLHRSKFSRILAILFFCSSVFLVLVFVSSFSILSQARAKKNIRCEFDSASRILPSIVSEDYKCTGSCHCDIEEERRVSTIIHRSFVYLIPAISSVIALKFARKHFEKKCEEIMVDNCEQSFVRSEISACEKVIPDSSKSKIDRESKRNYKCSGHCVPFKDIKIVHERFNNYIKKGKDDEEWKRYEAFKSYVSYNCEKLTLDSEEIIVRDDEEAPYLNSKDEEKISLFIARKKHQKLMNSFCKSNSKLLKELAPCMIEEYKVPEVNHICSSQELSGSISNIHCEKLYTAN